MGGNVFTVAASDGQPPLDVPRMTPEQYQHMKDACVTTLKQVYYYVAVPREAPGKASHGDVDIHVSKPKRAITMREIGEILAAERMDLTGTVTNSFALLLPSLSRASAVQYAQVDIHRATEGLEAWEILLGSYGDLMQIVGKFLRYAGLTANNKGLHVRLPEIEQAGQKKLSMLFLTADVEAFMAFVGLDYKQWEEGFSTQDDLFTWCCAGRFFSVAAFESDREVARDRQRMRKREMFKTFANVWLPEHHTLLSCSDNQGKLRQQVLEDALSCFGKQDECFSKLELFRQSRSQRSSRK